MVRPRPRGGAGSGRSRGAAGGGTGARSRGGASDWASGAGASEWVSLPRGTGCQSCRERPVVAKTQVRGRILEFMCEWCITHELEIYGRHGRESYGKRQSKIV